MALNLSKDYTFSPNTVISSSEVNTDFDELYNAFTGLEATTSTLAKLKMDADPTTALEVATKQYVDVYATWKRPSLTYVSATTVDVQDNTGTANQTRIIFPDGNYRSVTEDTSSANKYRRALITATAEFTSGTEDSGLRSGLSESANLWYSVYAVKSQINSANFVLVIDSTLPSQANFGTLNTNLGTNSWVHLGYIRNGNSGTTNSDILSFVEAGPVTMFRTLIDGGTVNNQAGILLADSGSSSDLTYTYASGGGDLQIPLSITHALYGIDTSTSSAVRMSLNNAGNTTRWSSGWAEVTGNIWAWMPASEGARMTSGGALAVDIALRGYFDSALANGSNPIF